MRKLGAKKRKKQEEETLRLRIKHGRKNLTLQERTVAKWIEYLTCYNGIGVNLVKVDGLKYRIREPESISPYRQKKIMVSVNEVIKYVMPESGVFSDPYDVICALITLRNNGVVSIDNNFTYLIKKYY